MVATKIRWWQQRKLTVTHGQRPAFDWGPPNPVRKQAASSVVLLKNEAGALPLKAPKSIAVFGNSAGDDTQGFYNQDNFEYGSLSVGGGSGTGRLTYLVTPLEAVKTRAAQDKALVQYWLNNTLIAGTEDIRTLWIPKAPEVCLVFLKSWAAEGSDRTTLDLEWEGNEVVESVARICNNTIVVTHYRDVVSQQWRIPTGDFTAHVGFSSRDLPVNTTLTAISA
ncbi:hypothetical protein SCUCBS95973_001624 [Sporothrix curviconia]|uniref:beta-glucosidase n=1 Tax=Sporothrix curviconia TaxID=1260050 RepID=A0ABP0B059_9PEZI